MTKTLWMAAFVAGSLAICFAVSNAPAQHTTPPTAAAARPAPGAVALLDVTYLFKHLNRMKAQMAALKKDVEAAEAWVKREKDALRNLAEQLKGFKAGTPDYNQLEEQITKRSADLQFAMKKHRREFLQREAKVYHRIYQEVLQEVEYFARNNGFAMVLRFNGDEINAEKPEDVLRGINSPVVYYSKELDITPDILNRLNQRAPAAVTQNPRHSGVPMQHMPRRQ